MIAQLKDPSLLQSFKQDGFAIVRKMIPKDICLAIKNEGLSRVECSHGNYAPVINIHRQRSVFLRAMEYRPLLDIIEQMCNGFVRGLQSQFFYHMPGTPGFAWHQDNFYVQANPADHFVSAWLALDNNISKESGALKVAVGSHKLGLCPAKPTHKIYELSHQQDVNASKVESILS